MKFLYAAYLITWSVIICYILSMLVGFQKVSKDMHDLER
jgi:CcmD family protein